jgi:16S rRNA (adenine1518-N6/adenine1519-N6)-dimethyltransferase
MSAKQSPGSRTKYLDAHTLIHRYGLGPKRSLGQNFLVDERHLTDIIQAADLQPDDTVLEIGPGLGVLTHRLAARAGRVVAVELDDQLVGILNDQFGDHANVEIVHGDILASDPVELTKSVVDHHRSSIADYKVVANLPYYITSPVLRHLLEASKPPSLAVVMVQEEVAERICAEPGQMSILAVSVQFYASPSIVCHVSASAFYPQPKVDSAVLCLEILPEAAVPNVDPERFFRIVRAGFSQKRKQLLNSLSAGLQTSKDQARAACEAAGIDPRRRAQTLSLGEWGRLYQDLSVFL